jgi:hypothetical protein
MSSPRDVAAAVQARQAAVDARRAVIIKYARLRTDGKPQFCLPTRAEREGNVRRDWGTDNKVIFPDRDAAQAAARELEALGSRAMTVYECDRSRHGHHHLRTGDDDAGST